MTRIRSRTPARYRANAMGNLLTGLTSFIKATTWIIAPFLFLSGCMHMGMGGAHMALKPAKHSASKTVQRANSGQIIDQVIDEAVSDLRQRNVGVAKIAVWKIKSQTVGLDVELVRQKLITRLTATNRFKVVSRERLSELLQEQSLSLSGTVDEKSAVEIGKLVGVEGFIDGYASLENNRFTLNLVLIETKSGVILWAKTIERTLR